MTTPTTVLAELNSKFYALNSLGDNEPVAAFGLVDDIVSGFKQALQDVYSKASSPVRQMFENLFGGLRDKIVGVIDKLDDKFGDLKGALTNKLNTLVSSFYNNITGLKTALQNKLVEVKDGIVNGYNSVMQKVSNTLQNVSSAIQGKLGDIANQIVQKVSGGLDKLLTPLYSLRDAISSKIQSFIENARNSANNLIGAIKDKFSELGDKIRNSVTNFTNTLKDKFALFTDKLSSFANDTITKGKEIIAAIKSNIDGFRKWLGERIASLWDSVWNFIQNVRNNFVLPFAQKGIEFLDMFHKISDRIRAGGYTSFEDLFSDVGGLFGVNDLGARFGSFLKLLTMYRLIAQAEMLPHIKQLEASLRASQQLEPAGIEALLSALRFGDIDNDTFISEAAFGGLASHRAEYYKSALKSIPSAGQVQVAFLRGKISEAQHDNYLRINGFSDGDINLIKQLYVILPPVNDLITFAVREVFTPETVEKFGQNEDFPEEFLTFAKQAGLDEKWAKAYWAAHWDLPSPNMAFEMFQRRIIDGDELKMLLKALDIMPFWRDKLIELSYNPLTRVDVRRMFGLGVLSEQEVYESYLDIGYSPKNAERMTDFTVRYESQGSEDELANIRLLTKSVYTQAYERDIFTKAELVEAFLSMGYIEEDAILMADLEEYDKIVKETPVRKEEYYKRMNKLIVDGYRRRLYNRDETIQLFSSSNFTPEQAITEVDFIDYEIETSKKKLILDGLKEQYISYIINNVELVETLNSFGFTTGEIELITDELNIVRSIRTRKPTLADFRKFYENGIISIETFIDELKGLGYPDRYVGYYVNLYAS